MSLFLKESYRNCLPCRKRNGNKTGKAEFFFPAFRMFISFILFYFDSKWIRNRIDFFFFFIVFFYYKVFLYLTIKLLLSSYKQLSISIIIYFHENNVECRFKWWEEVGKKIFFFHISFCMNPLNWGSNHGHTGD